ncbi:GGDEF domain-containing protein [Dyella soli]|uniref:diguanylate cyclase n=2 Tax=Dyella soli TaxID=522319 RepID=A0A4R0YMC8_9GAMM|nr:GGDEF domain-containing protein [Dyella soli]
MACGALVQPGHAATSVTDPAAFLDQTESVRTKDHPRFVRMLEQIHLDASQLSAGEQWHLRYLDAWQTAFEGDYAKANGMLQDVIDHSGDKTLVAKASALLMNDLGLNSRYEEAFTLANRLAADLPGITDRLARFTVLANLSQLMTFAGQYDLAITYAHMMEDSLPPGETLCNPLSMQATALYDSKHLSSSSPRLQHAIDACLAAGQPVFANTMRLLKGNLYLDEGQPARVLDLLRQISPSINANHYYNHTLAYQALLAQAYARLGDDGNARKAALAVVAMGKSGDLSDWLRDAYEVLYRVEKKRGHHSAALSYYEHFVAQDKGYLNDITARTLAYEVSQQRMQVQKLETEGLSKQNHILRLQQALTTKAIETGRLYNAFLLVFLASACLWMYRLKRSQLRFKRLSSYDGLTGIFNRQHFISEVERALRLLEKKLGAGCLIFIDLDHFKQVNDTYGHAAGDAVLRHTVAICREHLRTTDLFGRLGGEEFGILILECSREQGMAIADRIRVAIETTPVHGDGFAVSFSASVGLAATDTSGYGLQRLSHDADAALYRAKRTGRNRVIADTEDGSLVEA